jgi:hypothetical protein
MSGRSSLDEAARRVASLDLGQILTPEVEAGAVADLARLIDGVRQLAELELDDTEPAMIFSPTAVATHAE